MTLNFGHRGASGYFPENTMLAFEKAVEMGCHGIETDVHLTKDGVAVLCHDEKIDRTTDGTGFIKDYTYSELGRFDAGVKFNSAFKGLRLPCLDEFLQFAKDNNIIINLELKNNIFEYDNLEEMVIDKVLRYNLESKTIISSFNHYSVMRCRETGCKIELGFLYDNPLYRPGDYGRAAGIGALHPNYRTLKDSVIENIKNNGLKINTYTVNEEKDMARLIKQGIEGIITNYPDKLNKLLENV